MSTIQSQRRKVYDRMFGESSRVKKADIDCADPVARIPVTSEAYGKPVSKQSSRYHIGTKVSQES